MSNPKISVCLCVYNPDENYLNQAVDSIIGQSFRDWEMLLYDDGSDQDGKKVIAAAAGRDRRIRLIRCEEHHSLAYGLNETIKQARGQYIARMDADDISLPNRLLAQSTFLDAHKEYMWTGCSVKLIDEQGTIWGEYRYPAYPRKTDFLSFSPYAHPSVMIRRKELLEHGGYIPGNIPCRGEDYELFMRLHTEGGQGYNLQEPYLYYRETKESYKKRKLRFQLNEVGIRYQGFRQLGMRGLQVIPYVVKPLLTAMVPAAVKVKMKQNHNKAKLQKEEQTVSMAKKSTGYLGNPTYR